MPNFPQPQRQDEPAVTDADLAALLAGKTDAVPGLRPVADVLAALTTEATGAELAGEARALAEFRRRSWRAGTAPSAPAVAPPGSPPGWGSRSARRLPPWPSCSGVARPPPSRTCSPRRSSASPMRPSARPSRRGTACLAATVPRHTGSTPGPGSRRCVADLVPNGRAARVPPRRPRPRATRMPRKARQEPAWPTGAGQTAAVTGRATARARGRASRGTLIRRDRRPARE